MVGIPPDVQAKTIFITGTDTGVGKTVFTACLLRYLLQAGIQALAMKPFCSGGRADVELLQTIQAGRLPDDAMNPFYFTEGLAPLALMGKFGRRISLADVLQKIRALQRQCECLLIEGLGGVMAPLGRGYAALEIIERLDCPVIVVARNRLGTLNHTLLSVQALRQRTKQAIKVVLKDEAAPDASAATNRQILAQTLAPIEVLGFPYLGPNASRPGAIKNNEKKVKKVLARVLG